MNRSVRMAFVLFVVAAASCRQQATVAVPRVRSESVRRGEELFRTRRCVNCHSIGNSTVVGPDLAGIAVRRERDFLIEYIQEPRAVYAKREGKSFDPHFPPMPTPVEEMPRADAVALADYLVFETGR